MESDGTAVLGQLDAFCDEAIECESLIAAARQQAFIDIVAQGTGAHALDEEGIEAVEGAKLAAHEPAALWRLRICVGKMRKTRRMLGLPIHGDGVHGPGCARGVEEQASEQERRNG